MDLSNEKTKVLSNEKKPSFGTAVNQDSITENRTRKLNTKKLDILESEIEAIEAALKSLEQEINDNSTNFAYLQELFLKKETMEKELNCAYDKWEKYQ